MVNFCMQVRDRYNLTKQALASLGDAGLDGMTVTILDDRSEPQTADLCKLWCEFANRQKARSPNVAHYVRNEKPLGTGQLRNMVMEESRKYFEQGEYVAPHDNDTYFTKGWLSTLVRAYKIGEANEIRLLGAYGHPYHLPIDTIILAPGVECPVIQEVQALATQSMFMSWDTWDKYGPFCDTPVDKTCQSEDVDFTNRIRNDGYKLGVVVPHLVHATALKNTFGEPGPGWELVKVQCPKGVTCE